MTGRRALTVDYILSDGEEDLFTEEAARVEEENEVEKKKQGKSGKGRRRESGR